MTNTPNESYGQFPDHPLHEVPQEVLDAARKRYLEIVEYERGVGEKMDYHVFPADLDEVHAVADSVVASIWGALNKE